MARINRLKWGFKAKAERWAKQYREELNIHSCGSLCAFKLAEHLNIRVFKATDFLNLPEEIKMLSNNCGWSALTMINFEGKRIIIHNPFHSEARQQSDLMHELAHIICEHKHSEIIHTETLPSGMRNYNVEQEEEAIWLGSTLQLATPCLLWAINQKMTIEGISKYFNTSAEMVKFRLNMTGLSKHAHLTTK